MLSTESALPSTEPIVTANKFLEYKKKNGHLKEFTPPKIVLVCYQNSTLYYLLEAYPDLKISETFSHLYLTCDGEVGILAGWGIGAPALSIKLEQLIALGIQQFVAMGTAGSLMNKHEIGEFIIASKALAEDGVAHHYLKDNPFAEADIPLTSAWNTYIQKNSLPTFHTAGAWSFSAMFRETPNDVIRVVNQGYDVVEMEAATLFAIAKEKGTRAISLFVISDTLTEEDWIPHIKEPKVRNNLHMLSTWALKFCEEMAKSFPKKNTF